MPAFLRNFAVVFVLACCSSLGAQTVGSSPASAAKKPRPRPSAPSEAIEAGVTFSSVNVDGPYVAMTFDDGPHGALTPKLLDILAAHHIKATFFVLGECVEQNPDVLKRAAREGHEIASHSWSHPNLGKMGDDAVRSQLQRTDDIIKRTIGVSPTLFRPPYGSITPHQKHWIHSDFGYRIILWDVDPLDWKRPGSAVVTNRILKETHSGSIILSHDIHPGTVEAMPATFDQLQAKGFKFVTVTELLAMAKPKAAAVPASPAPSAAATLAPAASPNETR